MAPTSPNSPIFKYLEKLVNQQDTEKNVNLWTVKATTVPLRYFLVFLRISLVLPRPKFTLAFQSRRMSLKRNKKTDENRSKSDQELHQEFISQS